MVVAWSSTRSSEAGRAGGRAGELRIDEGSGGSVSRLNSADNGVFGGLGFGVLEDFFLEEVWADLAVLPLELEPLEVRSDGARVRDDDDAETDDGGIVK